MPFGMIRIVSVAFFVLIAVSAHADTVRTSASQVLLVDGKNGSILFSKNADKPFSPGFLAKMMTAEVIFDALEKGEIKEDTLFTVSANAWYKGGAPSRATSMFARLDTQISVINLLKGLIVVDGNDSAIILAEGLSGNEDAFAWRMNKRAGELQMKNSHFVNATGLPAKGQQTTPEDILLLARHIQEKRSQYFPLYSLPGFEWSRIFQRNRNPMIGREMKVDGFATGFDEKEGHSIVLTMEKDGTRLFLVLNGFSKEKMRIKAEKIISNETERILNWGLSSFEPKLVFNAGEEIGKAKVYGGMESSIPLKTVGPVGVLVSKRNPRRLTARIHYQGPLYAPVEANRIVGNVTIYSGHEVLTRQPVMTASGTEEAGMVKKARDALFEISFGWLRKYL